MPKHLLIIEQSLDLGHLINYIDILYGVATGKVVTLCLEI